MRRVEQLSGQTGPSTSQSDLLWQSPTASRLELVSMLTLRPPLQPLNGYRMKSFDCNHPDVTGYSVACDGSALFDIIAHKRGEEPKATNYEDATAFLSHWMYMPINEGEYITHISRQAGSMGLPRLEVVGLTVW